MAIFLELGEDLFLDDFLKGVHEDVRPEQELPAFFFRQAELVWEYAEGDRDPKEAIGLEVLAALDPMDRGGGDAGPLCELGLAHSAPHLSDVLANDVSIVGEFALFVLFHRLVHFYK